MHERVGETYRVVRHRSPVGDVLRAVVDDGAGAAELLVVPLGERSAWEHQVRVMGECPSPHLPEVRDLQLDPDGTVRIVRSLVSGERVDHLLETPGWCTPGRAVTLLHPIVSTVRAAHDRGAVLGGPDPGRILVTAEGRPVIADLTGAFRAAPLPADLRAKDPAHLADLRALEHLRLAIVRTLDRAGFSDTASSLPEVLDALADPDVLLRWGAAEPLVGTVSTPTLVQRREPATAEAEPQKRRVRNETAVTRIMQQVGLPQAVTTRVELAVSDVYGGLQRVRAAATHLSRRTVMLSAAALAVLAALVIVAVFPSSPGAAPSRAADATAVHPDPDTTGGPEVTGTVTDEVDGLLRAENPDDWASVVSELVDRWQSCAREQRLLCDDALHAASSAAELRASGQDGVLSSLVSLTDNTEIEVSVLERSGDAVVVSLDAPETTPASLLMIRSEAGWRVRDAWT